MSSADEEDDPRRADRLLAEAQALARVAVWQWDLATNSVTWSDELYELLGLGPREIAPSFEELFARVHPEDLPEVMHYLSRARRERRPLAIEYRVLRASGEQRTVQARVRATFDERGAVAALIGTEQDITDAKDLAAGAVRAERMATVGRLAGGVAHEINNPLATIASTFDLIVQRYPDVVLREARLAIDRIAQVVRGLAAMARTDDAHFATLEVEPALELAIALAGPEVRHRAELVRHYGAPPPVRGDEARLVQLFVHLLLHAAASIPEGQAERHEVRVTTRADAQGRAVIEVRDSGAGLPRERRETRDPRERERGRGRAPEPALPAGGPERGRGLAMSHAIVHALGGELTFRSDAGRGSTFCVALPAAPPELPARPRRASTPLPTADELLEPERRGRVLIVDDEVPFAHSLRRLLAGEHNVTVVASGREALVRLRNGERYDVILCDLMMPDVTGADLHVALTELAPDQAERIIFVTGGAFRPTSQHFLEGVTNLWFEKPCDLQELRAAIRRQMAVGRA